HAVTGNPEALAEHLFGDRPCIEALVAERDESVVGFALFFTNYSTFLTQPGLYLEDLFVRPEYRHQGIATALLGRLASLARERQAGRLEWSVLAWNRSAIAFYEKIGATILPDWRICRLTASGIASLAVRSP
ncbi:MAG: GNAT family N-acetyltransferase, partial [Cyanobacteria bacterium J06641_5]